MNQRDSDSTSILKFDYFSSPLSPFVKWPGGKSAELEKISSAAPAAIEGRFLDPFVGGGSVLLALDPNIPALANDVCPELISLYIAGANQDKDLLAQLFQLDAAWEGLKLTTGSYETAAQNLMNGTQNPETISIQFLTQTIDLFEYFEVTFRKEFEKRLSKDLPSKVTRMHKLQIERNRMLPLDEFAANLEGSVKAAFYMAVRNRYNEARLQGNFNHTRTADFMFIREFCYASMFRFNASGEFNIPYGGISYNRKSFNSKIHKLFDEDMKIRLINTTFQNTDFEPFLNSSNLTSDDFIFIDPPYDSDFTDYDGREFRETDQYRLANFLSTTNARVMVVIGDTPLIRKLYNPSQWNIQEEDMNYKWTIKSRNERAKKHLTITNY